MRCGGLGYSSGAKLDFCGWGGVHISESRGNGSPQAGSRDSPRGGLGRSPQQQTLSLKCMKHRKSCFFSRIYRPMHAVHIHALIFPDYAPAYMYSVFLSSVTTRAFVTITIACFKCLFTYLLTADFLVNMPYRLSSPADRISRKL